MADVVSDRWRRHVRAESWTRGGNLIDTSRFFRPRSDVICSGQHIAADDVARLVQHQARRLRLAGLQPGETVAMVTGNCHLSLVAWCGIASAGGIPVPITVDIPSPQWLRQLDIAAPALIISHPGSSEGLRAVLDEASRGFRVLDAVTDPMRLPRGEFDLGSNDLSAVYFTSGSSGSPKAVVLSCSNLVANARALARVAEIEPQWRYIHAGPVHHLADAAASALATLLGSPHVFTGRYSTTRVRDSFTMEPCWTMVVPTILSRVSADPIPQSRLKRIIYGGSSIEPPALLRSREVLGPVLVQTYGQSESTSLVSVLTAAEHEEAFRGHMPLDVLRSVGRPVAEAEVVTAMDGELLVRGPMVARGYLNDELETAATFRDGWLHTGDIGVFDDGGFLHIRGRVDDTIKSAGVKVSPAQVESAVRRVAGVHEVAVLVTADEDRGNVLVAVVYGNLTEVSLRAALVRELAAEQIPRRITIVNAPLPLTHTGKLDRIAAIALAGDL